MVQPLLLECMLLKQLLRLQHLLLLQPHSSIMCCTWRCCRVWHSRLLLLLRRRRRLQLCSMNLCSRLNRYACCTRVLLLLLLLLSMLLLLLLLLLQECS
jgi:hypothetical protein